MRICYVSSELNIHDYRFLSALIARGYDVHLVSYAAHKRYPAIPELIRAIEGLNIIHRPFEFTTGYGSFSPLVVLDFCNLLRKLRPDVLHTGWVIREGLLGALSGFHPVLLMPYGSDILVEPQRSLLRKTIVKYTISKADLITCDCETVKQKIIDLAAFREDRIVTFPWGIELDSFFPDPDKSARVRAELHWSDNKILIMNRALKPVYGHRYLLEALPEILRQEPTTKVILIGSGPLDDEIRTLVRDKGLGNAITFVGSVPIEQMPAYLNAADVYLSSSLSDGTSLSLLEAMACALPVVVTDIPANREWVTDGHNGLLFPPKESRELSDRVVTLLRNDGLRNLMGQRNLAVARAKADWNKNVDKLEAIYSTLREMTSVNSNRRISNHHVQQGKRVGETK